MSTDTKVSFGSMAVLAEAVEGNAELNGVLPVEFTGGEVLNVVLFSRSTTRVVTPLNAGSFKMLAETSSLCESLSTVKKSRSSNEIGRFSVIGSEDPITVFGFPYEVTAKAGQVILCNVPSAGISYRNYFQERFDESTGKSFIPVILQAADFSGDTTFKVGDVIYQVVGVWDQFGLVSSSEPVTSAGLTVIPADGTLGGIYQGDVLCEAGVTLDDNVIVYGSLNTRNGNCVSNEGYGLVVVGNWISGQVDFNVGEDEVQQPIRIDGDWIFREVDIEYTNASGGIGYQGVIVSGNLIGTDYEEDSTYFRIDGLPGNRAGHVYVYGNVSLYNFSAKGGEATETLAAGDGGYLTIQGNLKCRDLFFQGGDSSFAGMNAGNGGEIDIEGDLFVDDIDIHGGYSTGGSAGNGGSINIRGSIYSDNIDIYGGDCSSDSPDYRAGNGGYIYIRGESVIDECNLHGGQRLGALSSGNSLSPSNGGNFNCGSNACIDTLSIYGGNVMTSNYAPHTGGNGGNVYVDGNFTVSSLYGYGGGSLSGAASCPGGNGAAVAVNGNMVASSAVSLNGGAGTGGNGGAGGHIEVQGTIVTSGTIDLTGGASGVAGESPALTGGACGSMNIFGGGSVYLIKLLDGSGEDAPAIPAGLIMSGMLSVGAIELDVRSNVYITGRAGATLRVNSMPVKAALHHIVGGNYVESGDINDYTMGSLFISAGESMEWMIIQAFSLSSLFP